MSKLNDQLNTQSQSKPRRERNIITGMTDEYAYRYDMDFLSQVDEPVGDKACEIRRQSNRHAAKLYITKPSWWSGELHRMVSGADMSVEPGGIFDMSEAD